MLETAEPSRTGIEGISRPRDDLHALLVAMHGWNGGFTRLRDLLDAVLLASVSSVPVAETADRLGLGRFWRWTLRLAESELFGYRSTMARIVARAVVPRDLTIVAEKRSRMIAPYLVAGPIRVTRGHFQELRQSREARAPEPTHDSARDRSEKS